jgi:pimeloyl-ACP methyl ester carboxylesterase
MRMSGAAVSVYDRMCWPEGELERALAGGAHRRELAAYLGENEYAMLSALARQAARAQRPRRPRRARARRGFAAKIYLLPGILGSQLGRLRGAGEPPDLLWVDPDDIVSGRLAELVVPTRARASLTAVRSLGAVVYTYLGLKLRLAAAGFAVVLHDYDWRGDLLASGRALAAKLETDAAEELMLIGHSMGGLLARAALAQSSAGERVTRVIGIGAPHGGSLAAVQALRASYPVVCRLAAMDREHDAEGLATSVFGGFLSLYQLLPADCGTLDLLEPHTWPRSGVQPQAKLLRAARGFNSRLATADQRFISILGTGQRTVTGIERYRQQFRYEVSAAGDGTVAASRATLPGVRSYSLSCEHSALPRDGVVAAGLIDLLLHGRTRRLRPGVSARKGRRAYVTDTALQRAFARKLDWRAMSIRERRRYLNRLNEPPALYRPPAARS